MLVINNCNCEFSFVIIVHYIETEQIELKVKSESKRSKGYEISCSFPCYFIFASGVNIEQELAKITEIFSGV